MLRKYSADLTKILAITAISRLLTWILYELSPYARYGKAKTKIARGITARTRHIKQRDYNAADRLGVRNLAFLILLRRASKWSLYGINT